MLAGRQTINNLWHTCTFHSGCIVYKQNGTCVECSMYSQSHILLQYTFGLTPGTNIPLGFQRMKKVRSAYRYIKLRCPWGIWAHPGTLWMVSASLSWSWWWWGVSSAEILHLQTLCQKKIDIFIIQQSEIEIWQHNLIICLRAVSGFKTRASKCWTYNTCVLCVLQMKQDVFSKCTADHQNIIYNQLFI